MGSMDLSEPQRADVFHLALRLEDNVRLIGRFFPGEF